MRIANKKIGRYYGLNGGAMYEVDLKREIILADRVEKKTKSEFINASDNKGDSSILRVVHSGLGTGLSENDLILVDPKEYGRIELNGKLLYVVHNDDVLGLIIGGNKK